LESSPLAKPFTERKPSQRRAAPSRRKPSRVAAEPEQFAEAAVAHEAQATPSGDKAKLTLTVFLSRWQAERLTARTIGEGKNLEALVAEILAATVQ
jgi:hypothetical protein